MTTGGKNPDDGGRQEPVVGPSGPSGVSSLSVNWKLTEEQAAELRGAFHQLRPQSLLINGKVTIKRLSWWSRLWRTIRGRS